MLPLAGRMPVNVGLERGATVSQRRCHRPCTPNCPTEAQFRQRPGFAGCLPIVHSSASPTQGKSAKQQVGPVARYNNRSCGRGEAMLA